MATYFYIVLTKTSAPENEEAFHAWYDAEHLPDCVAVPGVTRARRYRILHGVGLGSVREDFPFQSLAIYELETDDPLSVANQMRLRAGGDLMPLDPSIDRDASVKMIAVGAAEAVNGQR